MLQSEAGQGRAHQLTVLFGVGFLMPGMGCTVHVGANRLFLVTRMKSGFDADTLPTVVELSAFSRFAGVCAAMVRD